MAPRAVHEEWVRSGCRPSALGSPHTRRPDCRAAVASFDRLRMRLFLRGPWQMPDSMVLILSLSKDAPRRCNQMRLPRLCRQIERVGEKTRHGIARPTYRVNPGPATAT